MPMKFALEAMLVPYTLSSDYWRNRRLIMPSTSMLETVSRAPCGTTWDVGMLPVNS